MVSSPTGFVEGACTPQKFRVLSEKQTLSAWETSSGSFFCKQIGETAFPLKTGLEARGDTHTPGVGGNVISLKV